MSPITPLAPIEHQARRDRLRVAWQDAARDTGRLLITHPADVRYLSGFTGTNGQVLLGRGHAVDHLLTDARYEQRAGAEVSALQVTVSRDPAGFALDLLDHERTCASTDHAHCGPQTEGSGTFGPTRPADTAGASNERDDLAARSDPAGLVIDPEHTSWAAAQRLQTKAAQRGIEVVGVSGLVRGLREIKDDAEIERIARACQLTEQALTWLFEHVVAVGRTERELARRLEDRMLDIGADGIGFPSIVASGPHSAIPHHTPTDRELRPGELLTVDCGAIVDGYHADHTRTVAIDAVSDDLARIHDLVVRAQAAGRAAAVVGARVGEIDEAARAMIETAGYGGQFVHGTGHGVGLEIHEAPAVARSSAATLVAGMTLTVEPGVYLPGVGGVRIEDTIVITADGPARPLTDTPRGLRILAPSRAKPLRSV